MYARGVAAYARRVIAALAFWVAAVLFVIDVSLLSGWLSTEVPAAAATPAASPTASPSPSATVAGLDVALDGGATISFPEPPTQTQEIVETAGGEAVLVTHAATAPDETTYNASVIEYPPAVDVSDPAVNLIGSVSGAAGNSSTRIATQEITTYDGAPAVEFILETPGTPGATVLARNVLVDHYLYLTSVTFATGADPSPAEDFLESLVLPD